MSYVRLGFNPQFYAAVHTPDGIIMNSYHVDMQMVTVSNNSYDQNIALARVKYIIFEQFCNSIFIDQTETDAIAAYEAAGMQCVGFPTEPVDQIVGLALYLKLNAVIEDVIQISDLNLHSDAGGGITYLHHDDEEIGPFDDEGWWHGSHPTCAIGKQKGKVVTLNDTTWKNVDLEWDDEDDDEPEVEVEIIVDGHIFPEESVTENVVEFKPNDKK
jgi:hypothetical protein